MSTKKAGSARSAAAPKTYAFIQQGGTSNEIYRVRGAADFDDLHHRVENTLGRDDWTGIDNLLSQIAT